MDHGGMEHGGMEHGGMKHGGGMDMFDGCTMRMLWNADYTSTCIVHPAFQIHSIATLLLYMVLLFGIGVSYEYFRLLPTRLENKIRSSESYKSTHKSSRSDASNAPLLGERERSSTSTPYSRTTPYTTAHKVQRSLLYTSNVAISFFLMLVIMTYNAYLIAAVLAGAFVGHFVFHDQPVMELDRGMACH